MFLAKRTTSRQCLREKHGLKTVQGEEEPQILAVESAKKEDTIVHFMMPYTKIRHYTCKHARRSAHSGSRGQNNMRAAG